MTRDAIVVGSGPNGLAAAITLSELGHRVVVYEAEREIGGGTRSAELTLPGFVHDVCSSVHPMALSSEFFRRQNLAQAGLRWVHPEAVLAHPFDDGTAILITRSLQETSEQFGEDAPRIRALFDPLVSGWGDLSGEILRPAHFPGHPWLLARFGRDAIFPTVSVAARKFKSFKTRAVFAGLAAHSAMPLTAWGSAAFGLVLWVTCHAVGWPFAESGSQSIARALATRLEQIGGKIETGARIDSLDELPRDALKLCDMTPRQLARIGKSQLATSEIRALQTFPYGPGVFKIDWALDGPIPWHAALCGKAGTVHLGGTLEEIARSEAGSWRDEPSNVPFVLLTQPSLFDSTRAPAGKHIAWAYCHVPHASSEDMTDRIEHQVERFATGFKSRIIGRSVMSPAGFEAHDSNLIGGDISGGAMSLKRLVRRSTSRSYRTAIKNAFLCSSATPPGPGVHGLCGYYSARLSDQLTRKT